jgi:tRNA(Ile)-lysidine synthase TilS/MesJ
VENVLTNIATNKHTFHLTKFEPFVVQEGVSLGRPLLMIHKASIYEFAETCQIPHLLNTTPSWSNRGRFREHFLPAFTEQYGPESCSNLIHFAEEVASYGRIIQSTIIEPMVQTLLSGGSIQLHPELLTNPALIRQIFTECCHRRGESMPSERTVMDFIQRYSMTKSTCFNYKYPMKQSMILHVLDGVIRIL